MLTCCVTVSSELPRSTSLANGLHCSDMCGLQGCINQLEEASEDLTADDSDVECKDD